MSMPQSAASPDLVLHIDNDGLLVEFTWYGWRRVV